MNVGKYYSFIYKFVENKALITIVLTLSDSRGEHFSPNWTISPHCYYP